MSCNICQTKFSFFTKEVACPSCGFSYCNKCLKYKCNIPDKGVKKVCGRCFSKYNFTKNSNSNSSMDMSDQHSELLPPVDITKKLDSLENPAKPPIVMYKHTNHWDKFKKGLEPADQEIVDRLRKLKEEDKTVALSVDEIKRRLALLKDEDPDASNHKVNVNQVDTRTDQQKADDLIQEYLEQLELSSGSDSVSEMQARLRSLQGIADKPHTHANKNLDDDDDDERHVAKKLIAKALAEAELEKKYEEDVDELQEMEIEEGKCTDDEEEKPSCVTCDQTENLERCLGCHGDLYCPTCFEDNHDDFEMRKHKREPATKSNLH
ncbi:abscission/NoCut checkpoint regulator isoform X1 [Osmia lignaria lignaria]|uniref:abscission/NoCut checkpoint regulator isoform X1 n=2 Tax=Osmia lignaria lignaria TaxID=1437193 RepID=UPI001478E194|nr:abscission/NoCut checkpoint regulator [Osmia lignaria]